MKHKIKQNKQFESQVAWDTLKERLECDGLLHKKKQSNFVSIGLKLAVAFILLFAISNLVEEKQSYIELHNTTTEVIKHVLPDSTLVYLNIDAILKYPPSFLQKTRNVSLSGEVFFNVRPNTSKPFIIETNSGKITVLGTSFNIRSSSNFLEVAVETGKVRVTNNSNETKEMMLTAQQQGVITNDQILKSVVKTSNVSAWKDRILSFKNTPLRKVLEDINRTYRSELSLATSHLEQVRLTTTYDNMTLDELVQSIALTLNITYKKYNNNHFVFSEL